MTSGVARIDERSWARGRTARLLPRESSYASFSERKFAEALHQQLPDEVVVLANQRFTDREGDREAALIVLWPGHGIAVIEVEGGLIHLLDGQWRQPWRNERGWKPINPVEQAIRAEYAFRDYLHQHPRWPRGNPRLVHMVALPATQLDVDFRSGDAPRWLIMDRTDIPHLADRIAAALRYVPGQPTPPTYDDVQLLVDCLAGPAIPQRDLLDRLHEREDTSELLSQDQGRVLDLAATHHRVEIRGGPGSGKTWLAVEKARRLAMSGKRVALLCHSRGLDEYLSRRVDTFARGQRPAFVGTVQSLGMAWGMPPVADSEYAAQQLAERLRSMAASQRLFDRFDAIVVDEGHDVPDSWWPVLLATLRDPVHGGLYVFSDEHQRVLARKGSPPLPLLALDLTENLRNTKQVAQTFNTLAPSLMKLRGGNGEAVHFIQCWSHNALNTANHAVESLLGVGWPAESIAQLTTGPRDDYPPELQGGSGRGDWASFWEKESPYFGEVSDFQGLERSAVVLAVDGFRDLSRAQQVLYVGLSRARDLLVVCGDLAEIRSLGGDALAARLERAMAPR